MSSENKEKFQQLQTELERLNNQARFIPRAIDSLNHFRERIGTSTDREYEVFQLNSGRPNLLSVALEVARVKRTVTEETIPFLEALAPEVEAKRDQLKGEVESHARVVEVRQQFAELTALYNEGRGYVSDEVYASVKEGLVAELSRLGISLEAEEKVELSQTEAPTSEAEGQVGEVAASPDVPTKTSGSEDLVTAQPETPLETVSSFLNKISAAKLTAAEIKLAKIIVEEGPISADVLIDKMYPGVDPQVASGRLKNPIKGLRDKLNEAEVRIELGNITDQGKYREGVKANYVFIDSESNQRIIAPKAQEQEEADGQQSEDENEEEYLELPGPEASTIAGVEESRGDGVIASEFNKDQKEESVVFLDGPQVREVILAHLATLAPGADFTSRDLEAVIEKVGTATVTLQQMISRTLVLAKDLGFNYDTRRVNSEEPHHKLIKIHTLRSKPVTDTVTETESESF